MLHMRLTDTLEAPVFNELRNPRKPGAHVRRQSLDLSVNGFVERLDRPSHLLIYQKRYEYGSPGFNSKNAERVATSPPQAVIRLEILDCGSGHSRPCPSAVSDSEDGSKNEVRQLVTVKKKTS